MRRIDLPLQCKMRRVGDESYQKGSVPGSVYFDLLQNGAMPDPFYRDNELAALKLMENDYEYQLAFALDDAALAADKLLLVFEGLDTLCDVFLNGTLVGQAFNMHRRWEFDIQSAARQGENLLDIVFHSPTKYIAGEHKRSPLVGSTDAMDGFPHLRKAHCMFGWDWGPRLPDMGVWRQCYVLAVQGARLDSVYISQAHEDGAVTLSIAPEIDVYGDGEYSVRAKATSPDKKEYLLTDGLISIGDPQLWWPAGYGAQPLYTVTVELLRGDTVLDTWQRKIGLRTLTVSRAADQWGEEFCHMVNGVKIFAMGADYIPEDNLLPRVSPERTRLLLEDARLANMNTVRVWGGGHYPGDEFYDICDELGLLVWQDFMFACALYKMSDEFAENVRQEFIDNVKRLRHHASLAIWCSNNEIEWMVGMFNANEAQKEEYLKLFERLIPEVVGQFDPSTFWWPSSPSSGGAFDEPNDPNRGDVHCWEVWHGNKPFSYYRGFHFRYASEFGFQSFPHMRTIESFTLPEDRNLFSYVMEKHQRNSSANGKIMNYMGSTFLYPSSFETAVYASQLLQAEAVRYGVEHWRRNRGRCMGAIYWQLNDCWPVASWASIDYFGRWKALQYYAKRFFAPVMLSVCEEGIITQNDNPNAEFYATHPDALRKAGTLNVTNETMSAVDVRVCWSLRAAADSSVLRQGEQALTVGALSAHWLDALDFADARLYDDYLSFELYDAKTGNLLSSGTALFCPPKHFHFADPSLSVRVEGDEVVVTAGCYARSVQIDSADGNLLLEDNFFDMNAGQRRVRILRGSAELLTVKSVFDIR